MKLASCSLPHLYQVKVDVNATSANKKQTFKRKRAGMTILQHVQYSKQCTNLSRLSQTPPSVEQERVSLGHRCIVAIYSKLSFSNLHCLVLCLSVSLECSRRVSAIYCHRIFNRLGYNFNSEGCRN